MEVIQENFGREWLDPMIAEQGGSDLEFLRKTTRDHSGDDAKAS